MDNKYVSYDDYCKELEKLQKKFPGISFYPLTSLWSKTEPLQMGVNWPALGTKYPSEAAAFAEKLGNAALAADDFKYNGYIISWWVE